MLSHDRAKTLAGLCGVSFAVCLALLQGGIYVGSMRSLSLWIEHSTADLWVTPRGTRNFDYAQIVSEYNLYRVRSLPGVDVAEPLIVATVFWRMPSGALECVEIIGLEPNGCLLRPWNVDAHELDALRRHRAVLIDQADLTKLQCKGVGERPEVGLNSRLAVDAEVVGLTRDLRAFHAMPFVITSYRSAVEFCQLEMGQFFHMMVRVRDGADVERVRAAITAACPHLECYTSEEFARKTQVHWNETTGVGPALAAGAAIGCLIGVGTIAILLYISTLQNLREYATLKALGVPGRQMVANLVCFALILGAGGFCAGLCLAAISQHVMRQLSLFVTLTPAGITWVFVGTLSLCVLASLGSILKIACTDPATCFNG